jgi:hypothetical protein
MQDDLFTAVATINAWFEAHNGSSPHEDAMRVMKIGEEFGEAVEAYIGMTGQNPRKGVTHSLDDLLLELADVAISALCAIQHFTGVDDLTREVVMRKLRVGLDRVAAFPAGPDA